MDIVECLNGVRFQDFNTEDGIDGVVSFSFLKNGRFYKLNYKKSFLFGFGKLSGSLRKTSYNSDFFGETLENFWEIAAAYGKIIPEEKQLKFVSIHREDIPDSLFRLLDKEILYNSKVDEELYKIQYRKTHTYVK